MSGETFEQLRALDPWALWLRYRDRLGALLGSADPTQRVMRNAAAKILGRRVNLMELSAEDLARLVVELDVRLQARADQLELEPSSSPAGDASGSDASA